MYLHMSFIFSLLRPWTMLLCAMSMGLSLFLATPSIALLTPPVIAKAKPKFFICPTGMTRDAVAITETYQINLCSQEKPERVSRSPKKPGINEDAYISEISIVAMRNIKTKKQMNLSVSTTDDIIYTAKNRNTTYRFDFNKRTLTIQPAQGKKTVERIISSD
jgi:hypothetical protein